MFQLDDSGQPKPGRLHQANNLGLNYNAISPLQYLTTSLVCY